MRPDLPQAYSLAEIAAAAGVPEAHVEHAVAVNRVAVRGTRGTFVAHADAVALVRALRAQQRGGALPLTALPERRRRKGGLAVSAIGHGLFFLLMITAASLGLLQAHDTENQVPEKTVTHLVYLIQPGPGGGGGGGGLQMPAPPPKAERKAAAAPKAKSPVPPPAKRPSPPAPKPPRPTPPPPPQPRPVITPPPATIVPSPQPQPQPQTPPAPPAPPAPPPPQAIVAPVASIAGDARDRAGLPDAPGTSHSQGPGQGGGVGSGAGLGLGEGTGGGIGPGSGGGTGGGPYRPGSGVQPPELQREVRANYTDEARKRGIEGDVVLEIVVRRDGSVGNVKVLQSLGAGLEQKAIDAVRQWRFAPATRFGTAVDVVVEVSVGFKLR